MDLQWVLVLGQLRQYKYHEVWLATNTVPAKSISAHTSITLLQLVHSYYGFKI